MNFLAEKAELNIEQRKMNRSDCHPLLSGKKRKDYCKYSHGFSSYEMQSLGSICEAILPPLLPLPLPLKNSLKGKEEQTIKTKAMESFYKASGSQSPLPDEVAKEIVKRGLIEVVILVRVLLWVLATRLGTFLLCGSLCFVKRWPFICNFSDISLDKREKVLQKWFKHKFFTPFRVAFVYIKVFCLFIFFSKVDETGENPTWEAIGYHIDKIGTDEKFPKIQHKKPLQKAIVETMNLSDLSFAQCLTEKGLEVTLDAKHKVHKIKCDVVVVGSGCGGSVAAAVLASSGHKVIVLEKGNYFSSTDYSTLEGPSYDQLYESGGILPTTDGNITIMADQRSAVAQLLIGQLASEHQTIFSKNGQKIKRLLYLEAMNIHLQWMLSVKGSVLPTIVQERGSRIKYFEKGVGLKVETVPRNCPEDHYCGSCGFGCRRGEKQGTDSTWLVDAVDHGAVVLTGCKAEKFILVKNKSGRKINKKCLGVLAKSLGKTMGKKLQIESKITISACGALLTPPLMIASGLKNPHIGKHLHLHPVAMVWGYFPESNSDLKGNAFEGGIITSVHKLAPSDTNSNVKAIIETPALGPASYSALHPWVSGLDMKERMVKYARTAHLIPIVRDFGSREVKSEGRISYRLSETDKENVKAGMRRALSILVAAGAVEVGTHRSDGQRIKCQGIGKMEMEEFLEMIYAEGGPLSLVENWTIYSSAHQMGSCRIGLSEREGAVDEHGESWEAEGLFVCDASLLPTAVGVNPMITIQSVAFCISNRIVESLKMYI